MRLQKYFPGEHSETGFGFSFVAAIAAYSIFTSWLGVLPGFLSFLGAFVLAYISLGVIFHFEDRGRIELHRGERVEKLLRLVAESQVKDPDYVAAGDLKR